MLYGRMKNILNKRRQTCFKILSKLIMFKSFFRHLDVSMKRESSTNKKALENISKFMFNFLSSFLIT